VIEEGCFICFDDLDIKNKYIKSPASLLGFFIFKQQ